MRKGLLVVEVAVLASVALWLAACASSGARAGVPPELAEVVAQAIIDHRLRHGDMGYRCPEGAIVAHVATTETHGEPFLPLRIWRCSQGQLTAERKDALDRAFGDDRSEWPPSTYVFAFESATATRAVVDVHTFYSMGDWESSRGGHAQRWQLEKESGAWVVTEIETYEYWD